MAFPNLPQYRVNPHPSTCARPRVQNFSLDETGVKERHFAPQEDDARRKLIERATAMRMMPAKEREAIIHAKEAKRADRLAHTGGSTIGGGGTGLGATGLGRTGAGIDAEAIASGGLADIPSDVLTEKQVLRFYGYTKESVPESPLEAYRVRQVVICVHLRDDSIEVFEPREDNSGLAQGPVLKRGQIPKRGGTHVGVTPKAGVETHKPSRGSTAGRRDIVGAGALTLGKLGTGEGGRSMLVAEKKEEEVEVEEGATYGWRDLRVGGQVTFYGRTYHINDADGFTREWYRQHGILLHSPEPVPEDEVTRRKHHAELTLPGPKSQRGHHKKLFEDKVYIEAQRGKFLRDPRRRAQWEAHDGEILRFDCTWEDGRSEEEVDIRHLILEYFLADDEVRVLEVHGENDGREPSATLLKKAPLPLDWRGMRRQMPGYDSAVSGPAIREDVLAISGYIPPSGAKSGPRGPAPLEHVRPWHLCVGQTVDVYGRKLFLRGCDRFTREWYKRERNFEQPAAQYEREVEEERPRLPVPPHPGIGDEDDTYQSCLSFKPRPPRRDFGKWAAYGTAVAKFRARLHNVEGDEAIRRFTISAYPADDSLYVFERGNPMIGPAGRKFLNRGKYRHPDSRVIEAEHFVPGSLVTIARRVFRIDDADIGTRQLFPDLDVPIPQDGHDNAFPRPEWAKSEDGTIPRDSEDARMAIEEERLHKEETEIRHARAVVRHKTYGEVSIGVNHPQEEQAKHDGDGIYQVPDDF